MIGDRWNVTDDEVARHYPCDDLVHAPTLQAWRGITVHTTPETLWPWVGQIRIAPYSYDWIDNQHIEIYFNEPLTAGTDERLRDAIIGTVL